MHPLNPYRGNPHADAIEQEMQDQMATHNIELLQRAIERSGLSARAFAREIWRDERTVRRWLSGESPVPKVVTDRLREELDRASK